MPQWKQLAPRTIQKFHVIRQAPLENHQCKEKSVREHTAAGGAMRHGAFGEGGGEEPICAIIAASASRAILHLRRVLTKGESLGTVQLGTLLDLTKSALTGELVLFVIHLDVVLRVTERPVRSEERAVSAIQNVHVWVCKIGISIDIDRAVLVTNVLGHNGRTMRRVFTV
jgi:hypothetical protein